MRSLITRHGILRGDPWAAFDGPPAQAPAHADLLVALDTWLAAREGLRARPGRTGVRLAPGDDPARLAPALDGLSLVAVDFPSFTDGRGFSLGRLLRSRHGWRGELRATGPLVRDVLFPLARCGFDAFELREGEDAAAALSEFDAFDEVYQAAVDRGAPFERRTMADDGGLR